MGAYCLPAPWTGGAERIAARDTEDGLEPGTVTGQKLALVSRKAGLPP
ncbi:hypothetical protein ACIBCS_02740 [Streptomyces phaeochromogenes]